MKNYASLFMIMATGIFTCGCFAQGGERAHAKIEMTELMSDKMSNDGLVVVSYHVEERINLAFGGSVTTYDVPNLNMISTKDLGPNNTRIITPKYAKSKVNPVVTVEQPKVVVEPAAIISEPAKVVVEVPADKTKYVNIDILSTYERVLDKGYQSVDMLKRVGNGRFFDGDLVTAAKWYSQLFAITTDLEPEYYYRYAKSLTAISETEKANAMMKIFEDKKMAGL